MNRERVVRWSLILSSVFGVFLLLALILPFLVDFSHFKPVIRSVVSSNINADLDFESARLQVFPRLGIKVTKVKVTNTDPIFQGTPLFEVDSLLIGTKFFPLLTGHVRGDVMITAPKITLARSGLSNNLASLGKTSEIKSATPPPSEAKSEPSATTPATPAPASEPKDQKQLMATIKDRLVIDGIYITDAEFTMTQRSAGEKKSSPVRVRDLDVEITDIGLERDIHAVISTQLAVAEAKSTLNGRVALDNTVRVTLDGAALKDVQFHGKLDFDQLDINAMNAFVKKSGVPLNVAYKGVLTPASFDLQELAFTLHTLKLQANANISDFKALNTRAQANIDNKDLAALGDLLPQHKKLLGKGSLHLTTNIDGQLSKLDTIKTRLALAANLTGSDLSVKFNTSSALPFKGGLEVASQRIDVDALLKPFLGDAKAAPQVTPTAAVTTAPANTTAAAAPPPKEFELSPEIRQLMKGTDGRFKIDMREVIVASQKLTNIQLDASLKDTTARLANFGIDGFGGQIRASSDLNVGVTPLTFRGDFRLNNVQPELLMAAIKPEHKNLLKGRMTVQLAASGAGTTIPTLNRTLNGKGTFKFLEGEMNTPSIAALMQQKFDTFTKSIKTSGITKKAFDTAEKLSKATGKTPEALTKAKADLDNATQVDIAGKASTSKSLKDVGGTIEIINGKLHIATDINDEAGQMNVASIVALDMKLGGGARWTASPATKQRLLAKSRYSDVLFNDKGLLIINANLSGTVMDPDVTLIVDQLQANVEKKLATIADKELQKIAKEHLKSLSGKSVKQLKTEAEKALNALLNDPNAKPEPKKSKKK